MENENIMENEDDKLKSLLSETLNAKSNVQTRGMIQATYFQNKKKKLTTLDDLLSWRLQFLQSIFTVKDGALKNSDWVDSASKLGVTKEMITNPKFYLGWILKDAEYQYVLDNWAGNCKVEDIKLEKFDPNKKNLNESLEDENEANLQKLELGPDNDFIKICKVIYRLIINESSKRTANNQDGTVSKKLMNGIFDSVYFKAFFGTIVKIEGIKEYFDNIDQISCKDTEFKNLQKMLKDLNLKFVIKDNSITSEKRKNGLLWGFGIVGAAGIFIGGVSAVNCYWVPFLPLFLLKGTAAVLSVAIPGGIGAPCMVILIGLLIYRKNAARKKDLIPPTDNGPIVVQEKETKPDEVPSSAQIKGKDEHEITNE